MGSGKSVAGAPVAGLAGASFDELDLMVEDEAAMEISDIFGARGEGPFAALRDRMVEALFEARRRRREMSPLRVQGDGAIRDVPEEVLRLWSA